MYAKKLIFENVGPIQNGEFEFPFSQAGNPKPVVLAGPNGSAKSIALSFVVNAVLAARQTAFEDTEVEVGKVYKYRSPTYIRTNQHYYYGQVTFEDAFELTEWQLDTTREDFENTYGYTPTRRSWVSIPESENNHFQTNFNTRRHDLEALLNANCFLYFPPNRFEEPAWLNYDNLVAKANFSHLKNISRHSNRQAIQYAPLTINKDWIMDVLFDRQLYEMKAQQLSIQGGPAIPVFLGYSGPSTTLHEQINSLLRAVLNEDGNLRLGIGPRRSRNISIMRDNELVVPNVFQLSTGQTLLLNLGLSILRDADLCTSQIGKLEDIRGLVVIDEVDLHLHVDLQYATLPKLLKLFPKVQFLITTHSPLFLMGMQKIFGKEEFVVLAMPDLKPIGGEEFIEFEHAYQVYKQSSAFSHDLDVAIRDARKPIFFFEGPTDVRYLEHAAKLFGLEACVQKVSLRDAEGFGSLDKVWKHFDTRLSDVLPQSVTLVYDCDIARTDADRGLLRRRVLAQSVGSPIKNGIENRFSQETLERARVAKPEFFDVTPSFTKTVRGVDVVVPEVWEVNRHEKTNLCDWLCENGSADDFSGLRQIFEFLEEVLGPADGQAHG